MDLAFDEHRVDHLAEIIDERIARHDHLAGGRIERDFGNMATVGEGGGGLAGGVFAAAIEPAGVGGGEFGKAAGGVAAAGAEHAIGIINCVGAKIGLGEFDAAFDQRIGRGQHRAPAERHRSRAAGAMAFIQPIGVALNDANIVHI